MLGATCASFATSRMLAIISSPHLCNCKRIALIFPFILLITSDNLLRQSISRNRNLAASLTLKIHGLSHNAIAELLEDYNIFFLNILKFYFIIHLFVHGVELFLLNSLLNNLFRIHFMLIFYLQTSHNIHISIS